MTHHDVDIVTREAKNDFDILGSKFVIEKGLSFIISMYAIHFNPEYYSNPDKFDPDRFRSEEKCERDPMTFLPFGGGQRNW